MSSVRRFFWLVFSISVLIVAGIGLVGCGSADQQPTITAEDIAANNRGVGLMGYFDYDGARVVFDELAAAHPDWHDVQANLAIATLNRQQAGDEKTALAIVEKVLAVDPDHLRARYIQGLLRLNAGEAEQALASFRQVARADPDDAYAAYYTALTLAQSGDTESALENYERALTLDPYLRSAYYGAFQALQRLKRNDEAREMLGQFQRLADNPQARLAEFKYTRMGEKGATHVVNLKEPPAIAEPEGDWFEAATTLAGLPAVLDVQKSGISAADINSDGHLDLLLPATENGSVVALGNGSSFEADTTHALSGLAGVRAALWGDIDNDGLLDAYLLRDGPNQLWRQQAAGEWVDITPASASGGDLDSTDGLMFDADHDGDLDILVINAGAPLELLNNNLDGTFRPLAAAQGLARPGRIVNNVVAADLDSDRDTDIVVVYASPPHDVFINDRLWAYRALASQVGAKADESPTRAAFDMRKFRNQPLRKVVAGDVDADGRVELYGIADDGALLRFASADEGPWVSDELAPAGTVFAGDGTQLALADVDGDGRQEAIFTVENGWQASAINMSGEGRKFVGNAQGPAHWLLLNLALPAGPAVLSALENETPVLWEPGPGRHPFMGMSFTGLEEKADSMRSNASGIGTRVDVRVDSDWNSYTTLRSHSGPGQSLQPLFVGLGGHAAADYVAMTWSDGVFQTELGLKPGSLHRITETQRQLSSCPVLFAWDGEKFGFVSDLLGVGGIGFNTGFGQYAEPRPWEFFLLPENALAARDGQLALKITEPMEEVAYIDAARLYAHWLPPGWDMLLDERMGLAEPLPTGRAVYFRDASLPVAARNERGENVLQEIRETDGVAAPAGPKDRRFIGRLAGQHELELEFDELLTASGRKPWLVVDGWVEYPYSQTGFAAWQAGADFEAPSIDAGNAAGQWTPLIEQFGYPAGMPRRMALPLDALPADTTKLRLRTNLEVYWDRIAVVFEEAAPTALVVEELPLQAAEMSAPGFPLRIDGAQRRPDYDFNRRTPLWDTRHPRGYYTAFGDVTALLGEHDDALAIVGPGEAVTLRFASPGDSAMRYRLVLETRGWAKDMDLYTNQGGTVGPLPTSGRANSRSAELHKRYNTRLEAGY